MKLQFSSAIIKKSLAAFIALLALAAFIGSKMFPQHALSTVILYAALLAAGVFVVMVLAAVMSLTVAQFILRKGRTDTQWLWFRSEPRGLGALRKEAQAQAAPADA